MTNIKKINKDKIAGSDGIVLADGSTTIKKYVGTGVTGTNKDSNDGSITHPWYTIEHAFEWINKTDMPYNTVMILYLGTAATYIPAKMLSLNKNINLSIMSFGTYTRIDLNTESPYLFDISNCIVSFKNIHINWGNTHSEAFVNLRNCTCVMEGCNFDGGNSDVMDASIKAYNSSIVTSASTINVLCGYIKASKCDIEIFNTNITSSAFIADVDSQSKLYITVDGEGSPDNSMHFTDSGISMADNSSLTIESTIFTSDDDSTCIDLQNMSYIYMVDSEVKEASFGVDADSGSRGYIGDCTFHDVDGTAIHANDGSFLNISNITYTNCDTECSPTASDTPSYDNYGSWIYEESGGGGGEG